MPDPILHFAQDDPGRGFATTLRRAWREARRHRPRYVSPHDRMVTIYPGVAQAIEAIRASGRRTGLVTSKNRQGALRGLALVRLEAMMDVLVCADEVTNPKPHPEPVEKAVALLGADPRTTV